MKLVSETEGLNVIVVGSSGGIGKAFCDHLLSLDNVQRVTGLSRSDTPFEHAKFLSKQLDITDEESIISATESLEDAHLIIIATGILHDESMMPEKNLANINLANLQHAFDINAIGPALLIKHLSKKLPAKEPSLIIVLSAKVGSIGDNYLGGWYGYRASKAALNMIVKTAGIELQRFHPNHSVVSVHPGTVTTKLSNPFTANYPKEKLLEPEDSVNKLIAVIDQLGPENNGQFINWDGTKIIY